MRAQDDTSGLIGDLIRFGAVETVDLEARLYTVTIGDIVSPPLRRILFGGRYSAWVPLSVGEQVAVLCAEGDIAHGVILGSIESDAFPAPASGDAAVLKMPDGSELRYDVESARLILTLAGAMTIIAPDGLSIAADVDITGALNVTGDITTPQDVKAGAISLKNHKHGGVSAGVAKTAVPE